MSINRPTTRSQKEFEVSIPDSYSVNGRSYKRIPNEKIWSSYQKFNRVIDSVAIDRDRELDNLAIYAGIENGQWPVDIQRKLFDEGRYTSWSSYMHLGTYNIVARKVEGIAGSIVKNPFDVKYVADETEQSTLTMALQQAYLSDKELMDWESNYLNAVLLALATNIGVLHMSVKNTHPASPMGNIAIESMAPGTMVFDPTWKTMSSKDCTECWRMAWMTAEEIKGKYNAKGPEIEREIALVERLGHNYEYDDIDYNRRPEHLNRNGSKYLVIEHNQMRYEKIEREIDTRTGVVFWEWMDDEQKRGMAKQYGISLEDIRTVKINDRVHYITTICPELTLQFALFDGKAKYQLGRLPYFPWSPTWISGKRRGIIDLCKDAQLEFNKRQSTITLGAQTMVNQGIAIDEAVFGNDQDKIDDFVNNRGNPRYVARLKAGASRQFPNGIQLTPRQQIPGDLFQVANMMADLMDLLAPQPAASEARTERSGESGIHFAQKLEVAKTLQTPLIQGVRQLWNDLGEAYFFLAKQLYRKGRRTFTSPNGQEITINEEIEDQFGNLYMTNDFSKLSRHKVIISEAPTGVNIRLTQRELNTTLLQNWPQNLPNSAIGFAANIYRSLDLTDQEREQGMEDIEIDRQLVRANSEAQIANAKVAMFQAEQLLAQATNPAQAQQPGLPGAGPPSQPQLPPGGPSLPDEGIPQLQQQMMPEPAIANPPGTAP